MHFQRCNQSRALLIASKKHGLQVWADTCKYEHQRTLKRGQLLCKTQAVSRLKWIKLHVSLALCKTDRFERQDFQMTAFNRSTCPSFYPSYYESSKRSLPCLLGHLILVSSGQLIQVGLQNGLHFLVVGRAERGGWGLAEGSCCRGWRASPQGRSGASILLYFIVQTLVAVGLEGHGWSPVVAIVAVT